MQHLRMVLAAALILGGCQTTTSTTTATPKQPVPKQVTLAADTFGKEAIDWGVPPTRNLFAKAHGPTPLTHPLANLISTRELQKLLSGQNPPLTIDVASGSGHLTIPGALWIRGAGNKGDFKDKTQLRLAELHKGITGGDLNRPIVMFCSEANCRLSYNAILRFHELGYRNLTWYRGGYAAWKKGGLPTKQSVLYKP